MKRRDFLSLCGLAAGSCLVPDAIARVIRDTCVLAERPYLILPRNPSSTLYAYSNTGKMNFTFYLGDPTEEEKTPTWRQYFDEFEHRSAGALGVDPADAGPAGRDERGERVNDSTSKTKQPSANGGSSRWAIRRITRSRSSMMPRLMALPWKSGSGSRKSRMVRRPEHSITCPSFLSTTVAAV